MNLGTTSVIFALGMPCGFMRLSLNGELMFAFSTYVQLSFMLYPNDATTDRLGSNYALVIMPHIHSSKR